MDLSGNRFVSLIGLAVLLAALIALPLRGLYHTTGGTNGMKILHVGDPQV